MISFEDRALAHLRARVAALETRLPVTVVPGPDVPVEGDAGRLQQIFRNILSKIDVERSKPFEMPRVVLIEDDALVRALLEAEVRPEAPGEEECRRRDELRAALHGCLHGCPGLNAG